MMPIRFALLAAFCLAPLAAPAQWIWVDKDGHKVFSDRPPGSDIAPDRVLRKPGARGQKSVDVAPVAAAQPAAPAVPAAAGKDKALEEKRKQVEAEQAAKKKAEEEKLAALREDNCKRSRTAKATFDSGARVARTNEKGEREILDDEQRAAEVKRLEGLIARDCK